jgi:hypothetical protein
MTKPNLKVVRSVESIEVLHELQHAIESAEGLLCAVIGAAHLHTFEEAPSAGWSRRTSPNCKRSRRLSTN